LKIKKVRIENFKSFKDSNDVNIEDKITILLAKNDQGKTNFLKAIESLSESYSYVSNDLCSYSEKNELEPEKIKIITMHFELTDEDILSNIDAPHLKSINEIKIVKYFNNYYDVEPDIAIFELKGIPLLIKKIHVLLNEFESNINDVTDADSVFYLNLHRFTDVISVARKNFKGIEYKNKAEIMSIFNILYSDLKNVPEKNESINNYFENYIQECNAIKNDLITLVEKDYKRIISNLLPSFVFFSDIELIKDSISINEYLADKSGFQTFTNLFEIADLKVEKLQERSGIDRRIITDEASAIISGLVNKSWTQEDFKVHIGADGDNLYIIIQDETGARDPPSRRSDGFQWYLSFYINFMVGSKGDFKNAVLLLDNPGSLLHASGQRDLLETLYELAENNQIIISTHSPFLIDKNRLDIIRILEKKINRIGTKVKEKFWESDRDALEPIRAAIGARVSDSLFGSKNNILLEGYSDRIIIESISKYMSKRNHTSLDLSKILINCACGADKILWLASFIKAEKYDSYIILDNDNKGRDVKRELLESGLELNENDILLLNEIDEDYIGKDMEIECMFDEDFYLRAFNNTYKDLLREKLNKGEITLDDLPKESLLVNKFQTFFKDNNLGRFDKIKVANEIREITKKRDCTDDELGEITIKNFENLFVKISNKFE